ncbi:hypothetical protein [Roseobacter sinensis]|uniref:Uncharacterized protein n=1 Tax=Roseobacter sinensis TaxID=2931391 RepID=A0ABT3BKA8_9RHOB|nr:hypothetical protein [Roseobacter sp. WL0113]MCV3274001.1 hypothetical protein [Roseobacter sp. WL0113]
MQLLFHTGAHFTEEERLMRSLLKNKDSFGAHGVAVPGPGKYRKLLRQTMEAMDFSEPAAQARDVLLDAILDSATADRVILSDSDFFGPVRGALRREVIYPNAPKRMAQMAEIFQADEIELFMAVKNPATFLPAAYQRSDAEDLSEFTGGIDPRTVRWSDMVLRIREAVPHVSITLWCSEDSPLIWPEIIREMGRIDPAEDIVGGYDLLGEIMAPEGMTRFRAFLDKHPTMTEIQRRRAMVAFLDKFALDEAIEEVLDMPGWTDALVDEMTKAYDDDVFAITRMPGVQVISP